MTSLPAVMLPNLAVGLSTEGSLEWQSSLHMLQAAAYLRVQDLASGVCQGFRWSGSGAMLLPWSKTIHRTLPGTAHTKDETLLTANSVPVLDFARRGPSIQQCSCHLTQPAAVCVAILATMHPAGATTCASLQAVLWQQVGHAPSWAGPQPPCVMYCSEHTGYMSLHGGAGWLHGPGPGCISGVGLQGGRSC